MASTPQCNYHSILRNLRHLKLFRMRKRSWTSRYPFASQESENSVVQVDGAMLAIEDEGRQRWNSGWQQEYSTLLPGRELMQEELHVNKTVFEKVKGNAVRAHICFALTISRDDTPTRIIAAQGDFAVPGVGLCRLGWSYSPSFFCRFPLRGPVSPWWRLGPPQVHARRSIAKRQSLGKYYVDGAETLTRGLLARWGRLSFTLQTQRRRLLQKPSPTFAQVPR